MRRGGDDEGGVKVWRIFTIFESWKELGQDGMLCKDESCKSTDSSWFEAYSKEMVG